MSCWPSARNCSAALSTEKFQVTCPVPSPVAGSLMLAANVPRYPPPAGVADMLCTSVRSLSLNATTPVCAGGGASSVTAPVVSAPVIAGALFGSGGGSGSGGGAGGVGSGRSEGGKNGKSDGAGGVSESRSNGSPLLDKSEE